MTDDGVEEYNVDGLSQPLHLLEIHETGSWGLTSSRDGSFLFGNAMTKTLFKLTESECEEIIAAVRIHLSQYLNLEVI